MSIAAEGDYCWLRIRIFGSSGAERIYPVEAELDDGSWYSGQLKLGEEEMISLLTLESEARDYGIELGRMLFKDMILTAYTQSLGRASSQCEGRLRIQLWVSPACSELQALMWERIFVELNGKRVPLSSADLTPFSRFTRLSKAEPGAIKDRPLRILIAVSNPTKLPDGYVGIEVEEEIESLADALANVDDIAVTIMPGRTGLKSDRLLEKLRRLNIKVEEGATSPDAIQTKLGEHHILHFLGHGKFQPAKTNIGEKMARTGQSFLYLENDDGSLAPAPDEEIVRRLVAFEGVPRLIFLSACETAKRDPEDPHPFVSLGPKLVEAGFPAVVAMQEKVPIDLARRLAHFFYHNLLQHGLIDRALNQSRKFLQSEQHSDWAIPVLFMRMPGGRLFEANPVRSALREINSARLFGPRWRYGHLPLEASLLTGRQIKPNWERVAQQTAARVDLWQQTLELLKNEKRLPLFLAISGERGTARSTHLKRLVKQTAETSLANPDDVQILPVYVDFNLRMRQPGSRADFLALLATSLNEYWPSELQEETMQGLLDGDSPRLRVIFDNIEDLTESERNELTEELLSHIPRYFDRHQFVITIGYGDAGILKLPITNLLDAQLLSRRKVETFLRREIIMDLRRRSADEAQIMLANNLGEELAVALEKTRLYDLAARPWLLARMVEQAESGVYPKSRASVLQEVIEDKVSRIPREGGLQSRALATLYSLAYEMQFSRRQSLPLQEAIPLMVEARGNREYRLEEMLGQLIAHDLLAMAGVEVVRFLYPSLQAYCCAQSLIRRAPAANAQSDWEPITAGLWRINQVRWWQDTLTLLCGMLENPDELLDQIIYGESFAESERVFLASRCLLESQRARDQRKEQGGGATGELADEMRDALLWMLDNRRSIGARKITRLITGAAQELIGAHRAASSRTKREGESRANAEIEPEQLINAMHQLLERSQTVGSSYVADCVMEALIWRSSSVNEPRSFQRLRAVEELGRQRRPEVIPYLTRVAMARTRISYSKGRVYEYGGIRQAAGRALRRMMPGFEMELEAADPALARVVTLWAEASDPAQPDEKVRKNINELAATLRKSEEECKLEKIPEALPAMAAFALGDIDSDESHSILYETFLSGQTERETRWAITDALALLDPEDVMNSVVYKLLPSREQLEDAAFKIFESPFAPWHEMLVLLIGQLRNPDSRARRFIERILADDYSDYRIKGRAILAFGYLNEQNWKEKFEQIALGDFDWIETPRGQRKQAEAYLRTKALQALAEIGDRETLRRLRNFKGNGHTSWPPEVERVFYLASEEINWRMNAE
ncbi:MAG TPA: CHAT domain-containing protein [Blastocatellia bacterium]|nr:CHAT domain-containing protein [Blastocatellia bacterium]